MATKQLFLIQHKHLSHCKTDLEHFLVSSGKVTMPGSVGRAIANVSFLLIKCFNLETSGASGEDWFEITCTLAITNFANN